MDRRLIYLAVLLWMALVLAAPLLMSANAQSAWWDQSYQYRRQITFSEEIDGYQYYVELNTTELIAEGKLRADCGDLRIIYEAENGSLIELDRWIDEAYPCNSSVTRIWFKRLGNGTYWLYYGNNLGANPPSNASRVFLLYDDFEDGVIGSEWIVIDNATEHDGYLYAETNANNWRGIKSSKNFTNIYIWMNVTISGDLGGQGAALLGLIGADSTPVNEASADQWMFKHAGFTEEPGSESSNSRLQAANGSARSSVKLSGYPMSDAEVLEIYRYTNNVTGCFNNVISKTINSNLPDGDMKVYLAVFDNSASWGSVKLWIYEVWARMLVDTDPAKAILGSEEIRNMATSSTSATQTTETTSSTETSSTTESQTVTTETTTSNYGEYYGDLAASLMPVIMTLGILVSLLGLIMKAAD